MTARALMVLWLAFVAGFCAAAEPEEYSTEHMLYPYRSYEVFLSGSLKLDELYADNMVSWQLDTGAWGKEGELKYIKAYMSGPKSGWQNKYKNSPSIDLGTFDNNATINEIRFLADMYRRTGKPMYRESVNKGLHFILAAQYPSGAWPQVYPARIGSKVAYSNLGTFNDDVMTRLALLMDDIAESYPPFDSDIVDKELLPQLAAARDKGVDFILKAQVVLRGRPTLWGQQHDPVTHQPSSARAYELPALCGNESVGLATYLLLKAKNEKERNAGFAALKWLDAHRLDGQRYVQYEDQPLRTDPGFVMWYRFYDLETEQPFFSGRDGIKKFDLQEIEQERRLSYQWGGYFAQKLITYAYANKLLPDQIKPPAPAPRMVQYSTPWDMSKSKLVGHFGAPVASEQAFKAKRYRIDDGPWQNYTGHFVIDLAKVSSITLESEFIDGSRLSRSYPIQKEPGFNKLNYSLEP